MLPLVRSTLLILVWGKANADAGYLGLPSLFESASTDLVIKLTARNFDRAMAGMYCKRVHRDLIKKNSDHRMNWLIEFYAPECANSEHLATLYSAAATELAGTVRVAKVFAPAWCSPISRNVES
jgi:hypothetical protein